MIDAWQRHLPAGESIEGLNLLAAGSLPRAWARHFDGAPARPAFLTADGSRLTYGDLDARSREVAARLAGAGLSAGDRVILSARPSLELVVSYVAAQRLGLVVVPVNSAYTQREVDHILADVRPSGAIVDNPVHAAWMSDLGVVCGPDVDLPAGPPPELDRAGPDDLALIVYTSGTTGAPKGAMLSSANLLASAEAIRLAWRWTPEDRLLLALPLFHLHGLGVGINGTLVAGASAVLLPKFDTEAVFDLVSSGTATLLFGVPTMYVRLAESPRLTELGRLRLCVSGSAPLSADLHRRISSGTGQVVLERYGMSETVMNVSNPYDGERRSGSVGIPLPDVEVRLADDSEILLRGPNVFRGYWERQEATRAAFTEDGWFRSGDLGSFDADGYLRIVGRAKDLIISGGYNVYPREVEEVLEAHPDVSEAAVAGMPSDEWGEMVCAWIVPAGPMDREAVLDHAAGYLASYKRPRRIQVVDKLPRNSIGKVVKGELRI